MEDQLIRLRANDPTLFYADANPNDCAQVAAALQGNTQVTQLLIYLDSEDDIIEAGDTLTSWIRLCQAVQALPALETLIVKAHFFVEAELVLVGMMLQHTRQIKKLELRGSPGEYGYMSPNFGNFAPHLINHPTLESFKLVGFLYGSGGKSLSFLLTALPYVPNLKSVYLNSSFEDGEENESTSYQSWVVPMVDDLCFESILRMPTLEKITLGRFSFSDQHVEAMSLALRSPESNIRELKLSKCRTTTMGSFFRALGFNRTLRDLRLDGVLISGYDHTRDIGILTPLSTNQGLRSLEISLILEEGEDWPNFHFSLQNIGIENLIIRDESAQMSVPCFATLCGSARALPCLKNCDFSVIAVEDVHVDSLVHLFRGNYSLKKVKLPGQAISGHKLAQIGAALLQTPALEELVLAPTKKTSSQYCETKSTSKEIASFVSLLLTQTRLKDIEVGPCDPVDLARLLPILAQNYHVHRLFFRQPPLRHDAIQAFKMQKTIDAITKLNKAGRGYLGQNGKGPECKVAGVNLLTSVSDDLDCIFYHLRENPLLCDRRSAAPEVVTAPIGFGKSLASLMSSAPAAISGNGNTASSLYHERLALHQTTDLFRDAKRCRR